jgi:hypothetical protein
MATMTYTEKSIIDAYTVLFNNLSDVCKAALSERLSKAEPTGNEAVDGFALSFGGWEGETQTLEEIKAEIKANRKFRNKNVIFE